MALKNPPKKRFFWNFKICQTEGEGLAEWYFVLVNYQRELKKITQRIIELLEPIEEPETRQGSLAGRLKYRIIAFPVVSRVEPKRLQEVYDGERKRDERLYRRQRGEGLDGLESYVVNMLKSTELK